MNENTSLHKLIELYFDGTATSEQERELRALLARSNDRSPEAEEARALLSFFSMARDMDAQIHDLQPHDARQAAPDTRLATPRSVTVRQKASRRYLRPLRTAVAAAVAIAFLIGGALMWFPSTSLSAGSDSGCLAYAHVQGKSTNDISRIDDMILSQLTEMSDAAVDVRQSVDEELVNMSILLSQPD